MERAKLEIRGMSCQHCVKTVTMALTRVDGVRRVKVYLRKGEVVVSFDRSHVAVEDLTSAVVEAGFETAGVHSGDAR